MGGVPSSQKCIRRDCPKWKVFIGRRGMGPVSQRKRGWFFRPGPHHLGREKARAVVTLMQMTCLPLGQGLMEGPGGPRYLIDADQKIPDWLIKITCLMKVRIAVRYSV